MEASAASKGGVNNPRLTVTTVTQKNTENPSLTSGSGLSIQGYCINTAAQRDQLSGRGPAASLTIKFRRNKTQRFLV